MLTAITTNFRFAPLKHFSTCGTLFAPAKQESQGRLPRGYNAVNAYALFAKDNFRAGEKVSEAGKRAAILWKEISEAEKKKYEDEAAKITKQRRANYEKLTPQAQNALKIQTQERLSRSDKFSYNKKIKELGKPKQPANAYALYVQEIAKGAKSVDEAKISTKKAAQGWNAMNTRERAPYVAKFETLRQQYEADLKAWESKMLKTGQEIPKRPIKRTASAPARKAAAAKPVRRASSVPARKTAAKKSTRSKAGETKGRGRPKKIATAKK